MSRPTYRQQVWYAATFPLVVSAVEGGLIATLGRKIFDVNDLQFAILMAAPTFSRLSGPAWVWLTRGRHKISCLSAIHVCTIALLVTIGVLPTNELGSWGLVCLVALIQILLTGVVTLESLVFTRNYGRTQRARVIARLTRLSTLIVGVAPVVLSLPINQYSESFRLLYVIAGLVGVIGVVSVNRVRLRRERALLRSERSITDHVDQAARHGTADQTPSSPATLSLSSWGILKRDPAFRNYMLWQMVAGTANMAGWAAATLLIVDATSGLWAEFTVSLLLTQTVPLLVGVITMGFFGDMLARMHIATFRCRHGLLWLVCQLCYFPPAFLMFQIGSTTEQHGVIVWSLILGFLLPQTIRGLIMGGSRVAWRVGHNDFGSQDERQNYMGIHVFLTGVRGTVGPLFGILLMQGIDDGTASSAELVGSWRWITSGIGPHLFLLTSAFLCIALLGFWRLDKRCRAEQSCLT